MLRKNLCFVFFYLFFPFLFLSFAFSFPLTSQTAPFKLRVTEELANIRQQPDIRSPVLHQVGQNTILEGLRREGEWYLVSWRNEQGQTGTGYIHESLVAVIEPETEKKEPKEKIAPPVTSPVEKKEVTKPEEKIPPAERKTFLAAPKKGARGQLSVTAGSEFFPLPTINDATAGLAQLMADLLGSEPNKSVSSLHWAPALSLEGTIPFVKNFSLVLNFSAFSGQQENSLSYPSADVPYSLTIKSKISALPMSLLLCYDFLSWAGLALGPEIIPVEYRYFYQLSRENFLEQWSGKATGFGFGLRGKIFFSLPVLSKIDLVFEAGGRLTEAGPFKGKDTHLLPSGETIEEEGRLYSFQVKTFADRSYPLLFIRSKRPAEAGVWDVNQAVLNLNGINLRVGLSFRF